MVGSGSAAGGDAGDFVVHLLDVGAKEYGDAALCRFADTSVLIDGSHTGDHIGSAGHTSIPDQIGAALGGSPPYRIDLLIVTHAHEDHIGCLPQLVADDTLRVRWALVADPDFGWGRTPGLSPVDTSRPGADPRVAELAAALREEPRTEGTDDPSLAAFLSDAPGLEHRYRRMLEALAAAGTRIVRHGRDDPTELLDAFREVGLEIPGASPALVARCAEIINRRLQDAVDTVTNLLQRDAALDPLAAYRRLVSSIDALDAGSRPGAAVNCQSIVARFTFRGKKLLFTGDMQFADAQIDDPVIEAELRALRAAVAAAAPYDLVKLGHHGSADAVSAAVLDELGGTRLYGICAGANSRHHPNASTLRLLEERRERDRLTWARTDRNGGTAFVFTPGRIHVRQARGRINNAERNDLDTPPAEAPVATLPTPPAGSGTSTGQPPVTSVGQVVRATAPVGEQTAAGSRDVVEVVARAPHVNTRITISIEIEPGAAGSRRADPSPPDGRERDASTLPPLTVAGGRTLPDLLFVTSRPALEENVGRQEARHLLGALRASNLRLLEDVRDGATADQAAALVRQELQRNPGIAGVVIVGGYDVVPPRRMDAAPASLRPRLAGHGDPDDFIIWNDDIYGDRDGDGMPELPVSRIPDGKTPKLLFAAIQANGPPAGRSRAGSRNVQRPFADQVFAGVRGRGDLAVSQPATYQRPPLDLAADHIYLMLHGDHFDATRFWGEGTPNHMEAINLGNVPESCGSVVFTGCCWGALPSEAQALRALPGQPPGAKTPATSIALRFLQAGALAFIGCTGAHYSPVEEPFEYFGGPLHRAFWSRIGAGVPPAKALFEAKKEYLVGMPHGQRSALGMAIESKIAWQFTCLGLGW